jgi:hypothetical protein
LESNDSCGVLASARCYLACAGHRFCACTRTCSEVRRRPCDPHAPYANIGVCSRSSAGSQLVGCPGRRWPHATEARCGAAGLTSTVIVLASFIQYGLPIRQVCVAQYFLSLVMSAVLFETSAADQHKTLVGRLCCVVITFAKRRSVALVKTTRDGTFLQLAPFRDLDPSIWDYCRSQRQKWSTADLGMWLTTCIAAQARDAMYPASRIATHGAAEQERISTSRGVCSISPAAIGRAKLAAACALAAAAERAGRGPCADVPPAWRPPP